MQTQTPTNTHTNTKNIKNKRKMNDNSTNINAHTGQAVAPGCVPSKKEQQEILQNLWSQWGYETYSKHKKDDQGLRQINTLEWVRRDAWTVVDKTPSRAGLTTWPVTDIGACALYCDVEVEGFPVRRYGCDAQRVSDTMVDVSIRGQEILEPIVAGWTENLSVTVTFWAQWSRNATDRVSLVTASFAKPEVCGRFGEHANQGMAPVNNKVQLFVDVRDVTYKPPTATAATTAKDCLIGIACVGPFDDDVMIE